MDASIHPTAIVEDGAVLGPGCRLDPFVHVCRGVTIERGVMVGAHVTFTHDRFPRATSPDLDGPRSGEDQERAHRTTLVREGATIGAGATIGCDLVVGRFAMVGMGTVVTRSVPDFALVAGNPARPLGFVCRCGTPVHRGGRGTAIPPSCTCPTCGRRYERDGNGGLTESIDGG